MDPHNIPGRPLTVAEVATAFIEGHPVFVDGIKRDARWISAQRIGMLRLWCSEGIVCEAVITVPWSGYVPMDSL